MYINIEDYGIPLWPIGVLALIFLLVIHWKRKRNFPYLVFLAIFWVYLLFAMDKVFFPMDISGSYADEMRQHTPILARVNIVPFHFGVYGLTRAGIISGLNNIILAIPFGFGLNFISRVRLKDILKVSIILGLGVELTQLFISLLLRYPYRVVDINDSIFNAMGVLLGYGLFRIFAWICIAVTRQFEINHKGLSLYIFETASQTRKTNDGL